MSKLYNLARMSTATTGTGTITLGSAVTSFLSFASAGVSNGETVTYAIEDGVEREIGRGVYTTSGTTLTRTVLKSTNANSPISLSGSAEVFITPAAEDIANTADLAAVATSGVYSDLTGRPTIPAALSDLTGTADNVTEGATHLFLTTAERTKLTTTSGTNTGDQTTVSGNAGTATALATARNIDGQSFNGTASITVIAPGTHAATSKTTPVDADELSLVDSAAAFVLAKLTWLNLKATLKTYFDTLYQAVGSYITTSSTDTLTNKNLTSGTNTFPTFNQNTTGSAATLTTTRAIYGNNFNGSAALTQIIASTYGGTGNGFTKFIGPSTTEKSFTLPDANATLVCDTTTQTLTNKSITPRVTTITSSATPAVNTDSTDLVNITALAAAITSMTSSLTGTPVMGQKLVYRIKDNGTARAIAWGTSFEACGTALPTTTVISKRLTVGFIYDTATSKWGCVGSAQEA